MFPITKYWNEPTPISSGIQTLQFILTPANSLAATGTATGTAYASWQFEGLGINGAFDVNIASVEFSTATGSAADSLLVLKCDQINNAMNTFPGYVFSTYTQGNTPQIAWTKREFYQHGQIFNGSIGFQLYDYFAGNVTPQISTMNYCLVTINFCKFSP